MHYLDQTCFLKSTVCFIHLFVQQEFVTVVNPKYSMAWIIMQSVLR